MLRLIYRNRIRRLKGQSLTRRNILVKNRIRASVEHLDSAGDPKKQNGTSQYHPYEEIAESMLENSGDATLTTAEASRTIIEVLYCEHLSISGKNF
jgi:hypothetical protein